ncbi:aminopeptidase P family protein [Mariniphaga sediminis]|uniref:Aminopeptidase P family protein n=1 Tax=Mariniphaga sediminis TaxID=1628158 RepID=A0A399CVS2_9BACT|nr:Xaa-Pro peptidase family protein [Mariniphaga sediminis]RIH63098.1 aminopeptidase P family protein [Mariniphaga sediminis]
MKTKFFIPKEEFAERIERLQGVIANKDIDAVLVFSTESEPAGVRYFSDYWPSFETSAVLVPKTGEPILLIGPESMTFASGRSKIERIIKMKDFRESSQPNYPGTTLMTWKELLNDLRIKKMGVSGWYMFPYVIFENIVRVIGRDNILEADEFVREVTLKKSVAELNCLREAARISELGFKAVLQNIKPGMTEAQLAGIAAGAMMGSGAEATGYPIWCCSGPNSTQAISRPSHRKVQKGEIIHFSVGAKVDGYSASIGRPVVLGHCPDETREFMQVGLDAENMTIDLMRAGTKADVVAQKVHSFISDRGYGDTILYGPAHGCGQMECEYPFIETSSDFVLDQGMVFMVDIFLAKQNMGFRWEDGVIITDGKAEELSNFKRKINIL